MSSLFASAFGSAATRLAAHQTSPQVNQLCTSEGVAAIQVVHNSYGENEERMNRKLNAATTVGPHSAEARPSTASSVQHKMEGAKPSWMNKWTSTPRTVGERRPFRARSRPLAPVKIVPFKPPKLYSDSENSDDEYIPRAPIGQPAFQPPPAYQELRPREQKIQATVVTSAPPSEISMAPPPYESRRNSEGSTGSAHDSGLDSAQEANELASPQKPLSDDVATEYSSFSVSASASEVQEQPVACEPTDLPMPTWMLKWMSRERKAELARLGPIVSDSTLALDTLAMNAPLPDEDAPFPDEGTSLTSDSEFHTANTTVDEPRSCRTKARSVRHRRRYAPTDSECDSAESSSVASMSVLSLHDDGEDEDVTLGAVSDAYAYVTAEEDLD